MTTEWPTVAEYTHPLLNEPATVRGDLLITSVRVEEGPGYDRVSIWNRGGKAGEIVVNKGDGHAIARLLLPSAA